ncbi:hypothetical protein [Mesorhizobium sp. B2-3-12]|uniref:hypothetical protein n=1 Tax=Mesorhizobium sp. B2-3-12 TaxID=2589952 RepID=UPI0011288219|nr:hypothetical protein [Mesorhizobium sp. B2-3-12]TPL87119.1 hypothetical protein FJ948_21725 [Mesorhizobium sp. B2-3-12]
MAKLDRKLKALDRAAAKRAKRVAAMSPEQRQRYDAWQKTHQPGPAAARQRKRADRKSAADLRDLVSRPRPAPSAEVIELERLIADRKADLARVTAENENPDPGAFG